MPAQEEINPDQLKETRDKPRSDSTVSEMFEHLMKNFRTMTTKERVALLGQIMFAATIAKIFGNRKQDTEELAQQTAAASEAAQAASRPEDEGRSADTDEEIKPEPAVEKDAGLPEDLSGTEWNTENILKCKTIDQCRALMKANGFILDALSGNYLNPRYLSGPKILQEPLVKAVIGAREITLKRSVMARLKAADDAMFKETGEHIQVGEHFRSNEHQFDLFKKLKPMKAQVAQPGNSFHEVGQAVDVPQNWEKAQKYLWAQGFVGGDRGIPNDKNHFSINEMKPRMTEEEVS